MPYDDELPRLYELEDDEPLDEPVDDELLFVGLLYVGEDEPLPEVAFVLLVRLPTLMPPLLVPVLGLAVFDGLLAELLPDSDP